MSKKQIKLLSSFLFVLFSIFAVITSDSRPQTVSSVKKQEVKSNSISVTPTFSPIPTPTVNDGTSQEYYQVVKVVDGDTMDVIIQGKKERLRLIGIDTPETVDPRKEVQCFGKEASNKAHELLDGKYVSLESDPTQGERDKYKRLLRYLFMSDGTFYNKFMIQEGFAHEYTYDNPYKYQEEFRQAEVEAREGSKGLWGPETCSK